MKISNNHYQVRTNLFHYKHVVEKGEWNYGSSKYIEKYLTRFSLEIDLLEIHFLVIKFLY